MKSKARLSCLNNQKAFYSQNVTMGVADCEKRAMEGGNVAIV